MTESAEHLTPREIEVLALLVKGKSNQQIALETHLGLQSVKNLINAMYDKLGVRSRTEAALLAQQAINEGSRSQVASTENHLIALCKATGTQPDPETISNLARVLDGATVTAMIDLMQGADMEAVFFKFAKRSLTPMELETLDWITQERFVSSLETSVHFGIKAPTAINRLNLLRRKGVLHLAFEWLRAGGGARLYYRVASGMLDPAAVDSFVAGLGKGRKR